MKKDELDKLLQEIRDRMKNSKPDIRNRSFAKSHDQIAREYYMEMTTGIQNYPEYKASDFNPKAQEPW